MLAAQALQLRRGGDDEPDRKVEREPAERPAGPDWAGAGTLNRATHHNRQAAAEPAHRARPSARPVEHSW